MGKEFPFVIVLLPHLIVYYKYYFDVTCIVTTEPNHYLLKETNFPFWKHLDLVHFYLIISLHDSTGINMFAVISIFRIMMYHTVD